MKKGRCVITEKMQLTNDIFKITFETDELGFERPGQKLELTVPECGKCTMPVCEYDSDRFSVVCRASTDAFRELSELPVGTSLDVITGVGKGINLEDFPNGATLIAQDMGIPVMLGTIRQLLMLGKDCNLVLGYNSKPEVFMLDLFRPLCSTLEVVTVDGSNGRPGYASDAVNKAEYVCAAGSSDTISRIQSKFQYGQFVVV